MAINITTTIRNKIYDHSVPQRMLFAADDGAGNYVVISNEEINVNGGVTFTLESINTMPFMFGCTPSSNVQIQLCNELINGARRYRTADLGQRTFKAYVGVQIADNYVRTIALHHEDAKVIAACHGENLDVYVLSNGHIVGNKAFGSMGIIDYDSIIAAKIAIVFDTIYVRYEIREGVYSEYKLRKQADGTYGNLEFADVAASLYMIQLWDTAYTSVAYGEHYFEIGYAPETVLSGYSTWGQMRNTTWGNITDDWEEYSGSQEYRTESYYVFPYGVWTTEMPRRTSTEVINLSAFDNMSMFDVDSAGFVNYMRAVKPRGKICCKELVERLCMYLGVKIGTISNFSKLGGLEGNMIEATAYQQFKSCKDILSYALEVGATNGLIDRYGNFRTYHSILSTESASVEILPYVYTTDVADYVTPAINKVLAYKEGEVATYSVKPTTGGDNVYEWSDNPFFNSYDAHLWWQGSDNLDILSNYRDAVVTSCANYALWCDDRYSVVIDGETCIEPIFSMTVLWNAHGTVTYSNSGCQKREQQNYEQREAGIINSNVKTISGDRYKVTLGDNTDSSANRIEVTNEYVMFGNNLGSGDDGAKTLRISNAEFVLGNKHGYVYNREKDLTLFNNQGKYRLENVEMSASSANMYIDPETGAMYRVTSLRASKDNIETIANAWDKVDNLRGVSYTSNCVDDDPNKVMYGFIAEEVADSVPELAEFNHETLSSVQYDRFTALLIEDCKESHKRIRDLEKRIADFERRLK